MTDSNIIDFINSHHSFVIYTHENPDGDAIGSSVAMCHALIKKGKNVLFYTKNPFPDKYNFLFDSEFCRLLDEKKHDDKNYDAAIVIDCGNKSRISCSLSSDNNDLIFEYPVIINLDHHENKNPFGTYNDIRSNYAACGELIFEYIKDLGIVFDTAISNALFTAIITDTGRFSYENCVSDTFLKTAELCKNGLQLTYVTDCVFASRTPQATKLIEYVVGNIVLFNEDRIAITSISRKELNECGCVESDCENAIDFAREIKNIHVAVFMRELSKDTYKVSFRSKKDSINVAEVASLFDGGGHRKASGCKISGNFYDVRERILKVLGDYI